MNYYWNNYSYWQLCCTSN